MSIRIIKGNIFKVKLANGVIRYCQFVGKDKSELNSDVIAIFKKHYSEEPASPEMVLKDTTQKGMRLPALTWSPKKTIKMVREQQLIPLYGCSIRAHLYWF